VKRLRDFHHPDGTLTDKGEKSEKWTKFNKFIVAILGLWLQTDDGEGDIKKVFELHL
jgi:hypothetical protein